MTQRALWQMLLQTRLHPPHIPADIVDRPRLDELLAKVFQHKLALVVAPAGYGKTTAVALWARQQSDPVAWVSLGTPPDELFLFVSYLVAALQRVGGAFLETELLVRSGQAPAVILRRSLVAELAALGRTMVVVLDDYDRVCCEPIHEFVAALVEELPPSVHLLMTVRARPQLVLARWRERQELLEVRASDLCCDTAETGQLLLAMRGTPLDAAVVQVLHDRTEGWAAGVRLAALSMQRVSPEQLAATLREASTVNVRNYLLDEVFALQSEQTQQFLVKTSILDRFCAPLCAAVLTEGAVDGSAVEASRSWIETSSAAGLFVISLDEVKEWYRYHHLFAELLRVRLHQLLDSQTVARLHQRAGEWYARHGLVEEAVRHFLASGDVDAAVRVVADHAQPGLDREDWLLVERWLAAGAAARARCAVQSGASAGERALHASSHESGAAAADGAADQSTFARDGRWRCQEYAVYCGRSALCHSLFASECPHGNAGALRAGVERFCEAHWLFARPVWLLSGDGVAGVWPFCGSRTMAWGAVEGPLCRGRQCKSSAPFCLDLSLSNGW